MSNANQPIDLPVTSGPAARALAQAGITGLEQACDTGVAALLQLHGVGPKVIRILTEESAKHSLSMNP